MAKGLYINPNTYKTLTQIERDKITTEIATRRVVEGSFASFLNILPDPDPILRKLGRTAEVLKDLLSDDRVGSAVERRKMRVNGMNFELRKGDLASDKEVDFIRDIFNYLDDVDSDYTLDDLTDQSLDAPHFGLVVFEVLWKKDSKFWIPTDVIQKPADWFHYDTDNNLRLRTLGNFEGIPLTSIEAYQQNPMLPHQFIIIRNKPTYENPYGKKTLTMCFWSVAMKRGGMEFMTYFVEKYGSPWLLGKLPRTAKDEDKQELLDDLEAMVHDAIAVIPDDGSVEPLKMNDKTSVDIYDRYIEICNQAIDNAILLQGLSRDQSDTGGSYGRSKSGTDSEEALADQDKKFPIRLYRKLIKSCIDLNFGNGKYPEYLPHEEDDVDKERADRDTIVFALSNGKFQPTKKYLTSKYNFEEDDIVEVLGDTDGSTDNIASAEQTLKALNLNGAQIASAVKIIQDVSSGEMPREAGLSSLQVFLGLSKEQADAVMGSAGTGKVIKADKVQNVGMNVGQTISLPNQSAKAEFASGEKDESIADQLPDKLLQMQIEETLKPVLEFMAQNKDHEDVFNKLHKIYPAMKTDKLENLLTKLYFIEELRGRKNVQDE